MTEMYHALGLHMHQPAGNLLDLIESNPWDAEQIMRCYERAARYALMYPDVARLHVSFSGILLKQFLDPEVVSRYRHIIDIPDMLDSYRRAENIELIGMGYYHPVFPLIPDADWEEQLVRGREMIERTLGRAPKGFWPPEMAFSTQMIPALVKAGYQYAIVDGVHVHPTDGSQDRFRPYRACYEGDCIAIIPRDRDISNAQESGFDPSWFAREVNHKTALYGSDRPRLVTTWSDGENGGWFRQTDEASGFFGHFFAPYMDRVRAGDYPFRTIALSEFLRSNRFDELARVDTGAWNVGPHSGDDLAKWNGSQGQKDAIRMIQEISRRYWAIVSRDDELDRDKLETIAAARTLILESETSCYLFWGDDAWLSRIRDLIAQAERLLKPLETTL